MRFRYNDKQARLDLGTYPNMSLKEARIELQKMKAILERGKTHVFIKSRASQDHRGYNF